MLGAPRPIDPKFEDVAELPSVSAYALNRSLATVNPQLRSYVRTQSDAPIEDPSSVVTSAALATASCRTMIDPVSTALPAATIVPHSFSLTREIISHDFALLVSRGTLGTDPARCTRPSTPEIPVTELALIPNSPYSSMAYVPPISPFVYCENTIEPDPWQATDESTGHWRSSALPKPASLPSELRLYHVPPKYSHCLSSLSTLPPPIHYPPTSSTPDSMRPSLRANVHIANRRVARSQQLSLPPRKPWHHDNPTHVTLAGCVVKTDMFKLKGGMFSGDLPDAPFWPTLPVVNVPPAQVPPDPIVAEPAPYASSSYQPINHPDNHDPEPWFDPDAPLDWVELLFPDCDPAQLIANQERGASFIIGLSDVHTHTTVIRLPMATYDILGHYTNPSVLPYDRWVAHTVPTVLLAHACCVASTLTNSPEREELVRISCIHAARREGIRGLSAALVPQWSRDCAFAAHAYECSQSRRYRPMSLSLYASTQSRIIRLAKLAFITASYLLSIAAIYLPIRRFLTKERFPYPNLFDWDDDVWFKWTAGPLPRLLFIPNLAATTALYFSLSPLVPIVYYQAVRRYLVGPATPALMPYYPSAPPSAVVPLAVPLVVPIPAVHPPPGLPPIVVPFQPLSASSPPLAALPLFDGSIPLSFGLSAPPSPCLPPHLPSSPLFVDLASDESKHVHFDDSTPFDPLAVQLAGLKGDLEARSIPWRSIFQPCCSFGPLAKKHWKLFDALDLQRLIISNDTRSYAVEYQDPVTHVRACKYLLDDSLLTVQIILDTFDEAGELSIRFRQPPSYHRKQIPIPLSRDIIIRDLLLNSGDSLTFEADRLLGGVQPLDAPPPPLAPTTPRLAGVWAIRRKVIGLELTPPCPNNAPLCLADSLLQFAALESHIRLHSSSRKPKAVQILTALLNPPNPPTPPVPIRFVTPSYVYRFIGPTLGRYAIEYDEAFLIAGSPSAAWPLPPSESTAVPKPLPPDSSLTELPVPIKPAKPEPTPYYCCALAILTNCARPQAKTKHNELLAFTNRHLCQAVDLGGPVTDLWRAVSSKHWPTLYRSCLDADTYTSYASWILSQPTNKQDALIYAAIMTRVDHHDQHLHDCKAFLKWELAIPQPNKPVSLQIPRLIQGMAHPGVNLILGAFVSRISKSFSSSFLHAAATNSPWPVIGYTSGANPIIIGRWYHDHKMAGFTIMENDFSRFDSTQGRGCLEAWMNVATKFNPTNEELYAIKSMFSTNGKSNYYRYSCPFTNKSGVPPTAVLSAFLNALAHLHAADTYSDHVEFRMIVLGDDNLEAFKTQRPAAYLSHVKNTMLSLGLLPETTTPRLPSYCSGHFIPFLVDGVPSHVLVPDVSRLISKMGLITECISMRRVPDRLYGIYSAFSALRYLPLGQFLYAAYVSPRIVLRPSSTSTPDYKLSHLFTNILTPVPETAVVQGEYLGLTPIELRTLDMFLYEAAVSVMGRPAFCAHPLLTLMYAPHQRESRFGGDVKLDEPTGSPDCPTVDPATHYSSDSSDDDAPPPPPTSASSRAAPSQQPNPSCHAHNPATPDAHPAGVTLHASRRNLVRLAHLPLLVPLPAATGRTKTLRTRFRGYSNSSLLSSSPSYALAAEPIAARLTAQHPSCNDPSSNHCRENSRHANPLAPAPLSAVPLPPSLASPANPNPAVVLLPPDAVAAPLTGSTSASRAPKKPATTPTSATLILPQFDPSTTASMVPAFAPRDPPSSLSKLPPTPQPIHLPLLLTTLLASSTIPRSTPCFPTLTHTPHPGPSSPSILPGSCPIQTTSSLGPNTPASASKTFTSSGTAPTPPPLPAVEYSASSRIRSPRSHPTTWRKAITTSLPSPAPATMSQTAGSPIPNPIVAFAPPSHLTARSPSLLPTLPLVSCPTPISMTPSKATSMPLTKIPPSMLHLVVTFPSPGTLNSSAKKAMTTPPCLFGASCPPAPPPASSPWMIRRRRTPLPLVDTVSVGARAPPQPPPPPPHSSLSFNKIPTLSILTHTYRSAISRLKSGFKTLIDHCPTPNPPPDLLPPSSDLPFPLPSYMQNYYLPPSVESPLKPLRPIPTSTWLAQAFVHPTSRGRPPPSHPKPPNMAVPTTTQPHVLPLYFVQHQLHLDHIYSQHRLRPFRLLPPERPTAPPCSCHSCPICSHFVA
jgi:hypothetical protein